MNSQCVIVTQCFYPDIGGLQSLMTGLADQCFATGLSVKVLADPIHQSTAGAPDKPYPVERFGGPRPWRRLRKRALILRTLNGGGAPFAGIFCDSWKSVEAIPPQSNVPVVVLAHGSEFPPNPASAKGRRVAHALARSSVVIANSHYTAGLVRPYLNADASRLDVIHPPVDPLPSPSGKHLDDIKAFIVGKHPVISTVARLEPRKGIDSVIRAMPEILRHHPACSYLIAGAGGDRARLEAIARELDVAGAIHWLGRISDSEKAALLMHTDVFAMPVRREGPSVEGFGMSYVEAGFYALPSVAGLQGGAAEAIIDGETGLVCDGARQSDVTQALLRLLDSEELRTRFGLAAQERATREFPWSRKIDSYLASFGRRSG
jgi:phosphatidyl-myo-inositol dimannoside synthase